MQAPGADDHTDDSPRSHEANSAAASSARRKPFAGLLAVPGTGMMLAGLLLYAPVLLGALVWSLAPKGSWAESLASPVSGFACVGAPIALWLLAAGAWVAATSRPRRRPDDSRPLPAPETPQPACQPERRSAVRAVMLGLIGLVLLEVGPLCIVLAKTASRGGSPWPAPVVEVLSFRWWIGSLLGLTLLVAAIVMLAGARRPRPE